MAVEVERCEEGVAVVTLTAESARNAFSIEVMTKISSAIYTILDDESIRAFVLTGSGKFFCAGADINEFRTCYDDESIAELVQGLTEILHPLLVRVRESETVYVAAMNGAAAGGGLGLALAADYRIALEETKIAAAFFSLGLSPDGGTTWLLPRLVGNQRAKRFFFNNETWSGQDALNAGAVDEISTLDKLTERACEVAANWGKWAGLSRSGTKQLLDSQSFNDFETQLKLEQQRIVEASQTENFSEGVDGFLEKRQPNFR